MEKESEREREGGESTIVAPKISARKATGHCSPVTESAIYWHSWVVEVRKSCGRRNEGRGITSSLVISSTTSFLPGNLHLASPAHLRAKRIRYIVVSCNKDQYIPELKFFRDRGTLSSLYAFMLNHISLRIVLLHLRFKRYKRQPRSQLSRKQTTHSEKLERRRLESTLLKQKSLHIPPPRETNGQPAVRAVPVSMSRQTMETSSTLCAGHNRKGLILSSSSLASANNPSPGSSPVTNSPSSSLEPGRGIRDRGEAGGNSLIASG